MSAKLLYNLSEENPGLHKQIGCMNGILQVFYRQSLPGQRISCHSQKSLPPGETNNQEGVPSSPLHKIPERNPKKLTKEKHRVSTESSSRASFSSSPRSSSFSSADISTTSQFEPPTFTQSNFHENSDPEIPKFQSNVYHMSPDFRDLIKDSINRETKGLSVKTTSKEENWCRTSKFADSPRPLQQPTSAKARVSLLRESFGAPKDDPRLSYDERDMRNGQKSAIKLKELPRLSLDSRDNSLRNSRAEIKSNFLPGDTKEQPEPGSHRRTTSSIVAKLMGWEVPTDSTPTDYEQMMQNKSSKAVEDDSFSRPAFTTNDNRHNGFCDSPRPYQRELPTSKSRNADLVKKMSRTSKFPIEAAPWKQQDGAKDDRLALKTKTKAQNSPMSVYGEIHKRLAQLEFHKSGKDLRALQQILATMEKSQQMLESRKENMSSSASMASEHPSLVQRCNKPIQRCNKPIRASSTETNLPNNFRSSTVIYKPAQVFERTNDSASSLYPSDGLLYHRRIQTGISARKDMEPNSTAMDLTPRPNRCKSQIHSMDKNTSSTRLPSKQTPKETRPIKSKSPNNVSTRLQQKKLAMEKQPRTNNPPSDSSRIQRQQTESASPKRKFKTKSQNLQKSDGQSSDLSSNLRSQSHQIDVRSLRPGSNIRLASNAYTEITSKHKDPSKQHMPKQQNQDMECSQHKQMPEPVKVTLEQPSPVSVLDTIYDGDESPSPVRKINTAFKEEDPVSYEENEWTNEDTNLNLDEVFFLNETANRCHIRNPDDKYVSEILLASGLLRDLEYRIITIQLHQSRLPINPNLFVVLEQSMKSHVIIQDKHKDKVRRKLVFDTVNEILAQKFLSEGYSKPYIAPSLPIYTRPTGQEILQTLCSEINRLEAKSLKCNLDDEEDVILEDLKNQETMHADFQVEIPGIALDIERLIFKDLINEVVTGEVTALRGRCGAHPRQLFTN